MERSVCGIVAHLHTGPDHLGSYQQETEEGVLSQHPHWSRRGPRYPDWGMYVLQILKNKHKLRTFFKLIFDVTRKIN